MSAAEAALSPGRVLGERYRVRSRLGSGGMGEVFRAFDLKLRVDVALKAVRAALLADERALAALRQEVRAARDVVSPNVCRVFDLVECDGLEFVSMEYVDGITLADVLRERSPLALQEARELASQFLAGLEAIHHAGLVHRDIKPENVMLTRSGRVVIMDFGIARAASRIRGGTVSGTPAYMAPEQARGEAVDARADVFAAGVVLSEMVASAGARSHQARAAIWRAIHDEPPRVNDTPWADVLVRAVAREPDLRYPTAAALSRALDEVTLRTAGDEGRRPYPGLASFTERDADFFVGRELEVEEMWKRLRRPHLLALIGPSGAGKTSFLRAGLAPSAPLGWRVIVASPGNRPFSALAHALAPELSGDAEAVARLIDFERPGVAIEVVKRWRRRHTRVLFVLDQFEELFTQNPPDTQERFAQLLAQFALDADVDVLLSMRDDFFFLCHRFDALAPVFSDVTAIGPPAGAALRRALVQPALKCGYRFEDETVVEAMLAQVSGERGALPLAAFAMARLWDARDRERGLLTRAAYDEIGGVAGALAQHAEGTLDRIGPDRLPIVRELFRNLVTAEGTRATLDRDELLSVFAGDETAGAGPARRGDAADVLDALIGARLLTSYELPGEGGTTSRRIEIVHESLLTAWPRLVRWRTQDQDGAQLRDQLRQAARLWEERGKPEDLLWTGTSFREYELWRERYAGALSGGEDTFARAMTARAQRRRRHRRLAMAAVVVAALAVAAAMGLLWRRSEAARAEALAAARHAEAQQLFTLGQAEIEQNPTAAFAYAMASLERADSAHARRLSLGALWQGPVGFALARGDESWKGMLLSFSNDGEWLAGTETSGAVRLWKRDGSAARGIQAGGRGNFAWGGFGPDGRTFVVTRADAIRFFSLPDGEESRRIDGSFRWGLVRGGTVVTGAFAEPAADGRPRRLIAAYPLSDGTSATNLGTVIGPPGTPGGFDVDPTGRSMFAVYGGSLYEFALGGDVSPRLVIRGDDPIESFVMSPDGARIYTLHRSGVWRVWSRASGAFLPGRSLTGRRGDKFFDSAAGLDNPWLAASHAFTAGPDNRWLAAVHGSTAVDLWDLEGPVEHEPVALRPGGRPARLAIDPSGSWLAVQDSRGISLWPLSMRHPHVLRGPAKVLRALAVDPHGRWIAAGGETAGAVKVWSMRAEQGADKTRLLDSGAPVTSLRASPRGDLLAAGTMSGVWLIPLGGARPEQLPGFSSLVRRVAFDRDGRRLAAGGGLLTDLSARGESVVRVWDLETREVRVLDAGDGMPIAGVAFMPDGRLLSEGTAGGVRLWDLTTGTSTLVLEGGAAALAPSPDGRYLLALHARMRLGGEVGAAFVYDLLEKRSWDLTSHGTDITSVAWHPSGRQVVTGSLDGIVRVGEMTGEEPHLLMGHETGVLEVVVEPGGRWVASAGEDGTVRIWPFPDGQPFHTLEYDELLSRLRSLTNYRVVADSDAASGYRVDFEPFTGWKRTPPRW